MLPGGWLVRGCRKGRTLPPPGSPVPKSGTMVLPNVSQAEMLPSQGLGSPSLLPAIRVLAAPFPVLLSRSEVSSVLGIRKACDSAAWPHTPDGTAHMGSRASGTGGLSKENPSIEAKHHNCSF